MSEFDTSFGVSTIYLAVALRDGGGDQLIGTELELTKAQRVQENLSAAGLAEIVDIRVGDALETLRDGVGDNIDLVLLDGAFSLYLPVLRLLEPHLSPGVLVIAENAIEESGDYLTYVRNPDNGYRTIPLPFEPGRGNEMSIHTVNHTRRHCSSFTAKTRRLVLVTPRQIAASRYVGCTAAVATSPIVAVTMTHERKPRSHHGPALRGANVGRAQSGTMAA